MKSAGFEIRQIHIKSRNMSFWVIAKYRSFLTKDQTGYLCTIITSRVCGRGDVFIVYVCVYQCDCLSVCVSIQDTTFEAVDIETLCLVWW